MFIKIDKIKYTNYLNDIDIRQNTLKRIYTSNNNLYLNPLGSLILNGNNIDVDQGKLLNVKDINGAFDQDINIKTMKMIEKVFIIFLQKSIINFNKCSLNLFLAFLFMF